MNIWKFIELTKINGEYTNSEIQFENIKTALLNLTIEHQKDIESQWKEIEKEIRNTIEFEKLHVENGGIVSSGDDGFYMDFLNWMIAQGEELYNEFSQKGHQSVIDYIKENNVTEDDCMFECMIYAFHDVAELR